MKFELKFKRNVLERAFAAIPRGENGNTSDNRQQFYGPQC